MVTLGKNVKRYFAAAMDATTGILTWVGGRRRKDSGLFIELLGRLKEALTMLNRASPRLPAKLVLTDVEMKLLEHSVPTSGGSAKRNVGRFLTLLARLGAI